MGLILALVLASIMSNNCHDFTTIIQEKPFQNYIGHAFMIIVDLRRFGYQKEAIINSPTNFLLFLFFPSLLNFCEFKTTIYLGILVIM